MSGAAQNVVITGASRGIGFELTRQFLELGHCVVAGCRRPALSLELKDLKETFGEKLKILELDVQQDASVARFAQQIDFDYLDILVNNAGVSMDGERRSCDVSIDSLARTIDTNTMGPIRMTQALLPLLRKSQNPRIANISSQMGSIADNSSGGWLGYRMSKAALNMFTKTLAIDEKKMVALTIHPGWVQTQMGGERAPLSPKASAEGLIRVIRGATLKESGQFFNYSGKELPW